MKPVKYMGYVVGIAASAEEALKILKTHTATFQSAYLSKHGFYAGVK